MAEERYDLRESKRSVRELYPVLRDAHGNVIDGFHRLRADPSWRTKTLEHIRTPTQLALARIIANTHRRSVSREEREEQINELAKCLLENENVSKKELITTIEDLTTFSDRYIRDLLSDDYKTRPGVGGAATHKRVEMGSTQKRVGLSPAQQEQPEEIDLDASSEDEELGSDVEEQSIKVDVSKEETPQASVLAYVRDYFRRYPRPDEGFLAWEICRRFGLSDSVAGGLISKVKKERAGPRRSVEKDERFEGRVSTCRCPLCRREGADRNVILMAVENPELSQLALTDFVEAGWRR